MKIIAFTQLRNELSKGNLENWFKQMSVCDYIYIYDQNSDDGSKEYYKKFDNCFVIESPINRFKEELICKQELLNKLLSDHPDVDWILWIDGDLMLDGRLLADNGKELREICRLGSIDKIDAYYFVHYNLWRSDIFYRTDDSYHAINNYGGWRPLWRNNGNLHFDNIGGLHHEQYPNGLQKVVPSPFAVVHRGFATDYQIMTKYDVYKDNGQNGWPLERLLDEHALEVVELDRELLPDWFEVTDDINPINKRKLREIYDESKIIQPKIKKNVEVIKSTDYLDLIYNEMKSGKSNVDGWDVTFRIVANDATPEIIEKLKTIDIPYTIYRLFASYGYGQDMENLKQGIVSIYIKLAMNNNFVGITGKKDRIRQLVYIDDVCDALYLGMINKDFADFEYENNINVSVIEGEDDIGNENIIKRYLDKIGAWSLSLNEQEIILNLDNNTFKINNNEVKSNEIFNFLYGSSEQYSAFIID